METRQQRKDLEELEAPPSSWLRHGVILPMASPRNPSNSNMPSTPAKRKDPPPFYLSTLEKLQATHEKLACTMSEQVAEEKMKNEKNSLRMEFEML
jgi:hypothetical protein